MNSTRGSDSAAGRAEQPEQLLDVFKAAALSVTKLYKTSAANEARARADGYQECLEDLLDFLDKDGTGLDEHARTKLRKWATDRHDGRERLQAMESDDESDKPEPQPSPEPVPTSDSTNPLQQESEPESEPYRFSVPTRDNFSITSQYPNIATLDLSDSRPSANTQGHGASRTKSKTNGAGKRSSSNLGRGAGSKRRHDFDDFWGGAFSNNGPKRGRHT